MKQEMKQEIKDLIEKHRYLTEKLIPCWEGLLKQAKEEAKHCEFSMREILEGLGVDQFGDDTFQASKELYINVSTSDRDKRALFAWLKENGLIDAATQCVRFSGSENLDPIIEAMEGAKISGELEAEIHPARLKSIIKSRLENGETLPPETAASVKFFETAKIKHKGE